MVNIHGLFASQSVQAAAPRQLNCFEPGALNAQSEQNLRQAGLQQAGLICVQKLQIVLSQEIQACSLGQVDKQLVCILLGVNVWTF